MFDAGVAVDDHRHVVLEQRTALGDDHHLEFASAGDELLALIAARLVVTLDAERADRLHPAQVASRVVEAVDDRLEVAGGAVEDRARGVQPGRRDHAPVRASSLAAKNVLVSLDGSCTVVTPKASEA